MERRDFFKLLSASLGTVLVSGCGSGSGGTTYNLEGAVTPVSYRFVPVLEPGATLSPGRRLAELMPTVQCYDEGFFFHAVDDSGVTGIYRAQLQGTQIVELLPLLREGDRTSDGTTIARLNHRGDGNPEGHYASVIVGEDGQELVVLAKPGRVTRVLGNNQSIPGIPTASFGSSYHGVSLHRNDQLLVVAHFGTSKPARASQGLFHLNATQPDSLQLIIQTNTLLPESQSALNALGLTHLGDENNYLVQAFGPPNPGGANVLDSHPTMLLSGKVGSQAFPLAGSPNLKVSPTRAASADYHSGSVLAGPRRSSELASFVLQESLTSAFLVVGSQILARTGDRSPRGQVIAGFHPPAFTSGGHVLYQIFTGDVAHRAGRGTELILVAGGTAFSILGQGDQIDGRPLGNFYFSFLADQCSSSGILAMTAELGKANALLVGVPG